MEQNETNQPTEPKFRLNIKQTSKGFAYFDVTAKGETDAEMQYNMNCALHYALEKVKELNQGLGE